MSFRKLLCESPSLYVPRCQNKLLEDNIISPLCIRVCVCGWSSIGKWSWPICLDTAGALLAPQIGDHQPHNCVAEPPMPHSLYIKGVLLLLRFNVIPIIQERPCVERRTHPCNNSVPSHHGGGAWMSQRWVNMLRYQGWFGSGWIPQAKFILPIYPADLKRCLCRLTLPSWRIFVDFHRLNHISLRSVAIISPQRLVMHTTVPSRCKTNSKTLRHFFTTLFISMDFCCNRCSMPTLSCVHDLQLILPKNAKY